MEQSDSNLFSFKRLQPEQAERTAPCQIGCAAGGDVRGWINAIALHERLGRSREEALEKAWRIIADKNPLPAVMGHVCPHPCEVDCNRTDKDEPVAISAMERFIGEWAIEAGLNLDRVDVASRSESVGVIGSGPAGLSFAYQMARRGYSVSIYESREAPGGMLRYGIPDYRLPPSVLDAEIARIQALGVDIKLNCRVGRDVLIRDLEENHSVLFMGIGAQAGRRLGLPGEDGPGCWTGTELLFALNTGHTLDVGESVVVVGGGNTAVDAARSARRLGADVTLLYRRTRSEMPAIEAEIDDAEEEGVTIEYLASPVEIRRRGEQIAAIVACRMELGDPDDSGRRRPVPIPDSEFVIPATSVVAAISQEPEWIGLDRGEDAGTWLAASERGESADGTFAGGDVLGLGIAAAAIAQGRRAAESAHARLAGISLSEVETNGTVSAQELKMDFYPDVPRAEVKRADPQLRLADPLAETEYTLTEDQFFAEAERCMSCGSCFGCHHCWTYCNVSGFTPAEQPEHGHFFELSLSACEGCAKCIELCPCGFLSIRSETDGQPRFESS
jgi:NADPH-dependent glutamate synthase beta subunit-like oxidoreductase